MSYSNWMEKNVFRPLDMRRTYVRDELNQVVKDEATSYIRYSASIPFKRVPVNFSSSGACCVRSTTEDLVRWIKNLETGKSRWSSSARSNETENSFSRMGLLLNIDFGKLPYDAPRRVPG